MSDADRQATIDQLSRHTGDGRLTLEEFEVRVDETWRATTHGDLQLVLRELPVERTALPRRRRRAPQLRAAAFWIAIIVLAVVAIGPGALWWLIPLAWFKLGAFGHHHSHHHHSHRHHSHRHEGPRELPAQRDELTLA